MRGAGGWMQAHARDGGTAAATLPTDVATGTEPQSRRPGGAQRGTPVTAGSTSPGGIKVAAWNAERIDARGFSNGAAASNTCRTKRAWLEDYLEGASPDVLGIVELIANMI
eukprot:5884095-Prymnesium_polylepis.1